MGWVRFRVMVIFKSSKRPFLPEKKNCSLGNTDVTGHARLHLRLNHLKCINQQLQSVVLDGKKEMETDEKPLNLS